MTSTSKRTTDAGVCSDSIFTRDAAGCSRICSASKARPCGVAITISPSTTDRSGSASHSGASSSGKYRSSGSELRLLMRTPSPSRKMIARKPSHFGS